MIAFACFLWLAVLVVWAFEADRALQQRADRFWQKAFAETAAHRHIP